MDHLQFPARLCSPRPQATHNRSAVCLTLKQWLIPASEQGRLFPVQVGQVRVHTTTGFNSSTAKASPSPIHSMLCTTAAILQSAWALASILFMGTTSYLDLRQLGSPGFWCLQPLKDRDLDARKPGTAKTPACISGTGALWIPSPGPDFADSPQQLGTTLQGHTKSSNTGKRVLAGSYNRPNKSKPLTSASLSHASLQHFRVQGVQGHFPANRVQQPVCARLAKGTDLHCIRPREPVFAGLCLLSTY